MTQDINGSFFKDCPVCKGTGELRSSHPMARRHQGYETGYAYPAVTGGCTGEVVVEPNLSYCGKCLGTGIKILKNNEKSS